MSMTLEKAIKLLKQYQGYEPMFPDGETLKHAFDLTDETVDTLLTALSPVSREQVEKVWRGEWVGVPSMGVYDTVCSKCGYCPGIRFWSSDFCPHCGAPMTDEAVDMVMKRLEATRSGKERLP